MSTVAEQKVHSRPPMDREASEGQESHKDTETDCCREGDENPRGRVKGRYWWELSSVHDQHVSDL